jgi:hypothetical protein
MAVIAHAESWTFKVPTALGMTQSTYELADDGLHFTSDDPMGASEMLPWASIRQGATAAMAGMGGRGMPDLPVCARVPPRCHGLGSRPCRRMASVWAMTLAACCSTRRYSVVCSGRWRS